MQGKTTSILEYYMVLAANGTKNDIDLIMQDLNGDMTLVDSKFIDYALSLVKSPEGVARMVEYLFKGTQIQRNYCTLFLNRRCEKGDWDLVKKAYAMCLIDERQAFSR